MICRIQLRRFFSVFLLITVLLFTTACGGVGSQASMAPTSASNDVSNVKGETKDINGSYHKLQEAAHDFRNKVRDEQQPFFNNKNDGMAKSGKALTNASKDAKNAFQRTADSIKEGLTPD